MKTEVKQKYEYKLEYTGNKKTLQRTYAYVCMYVYIHVYFYIHNIHTLATHSCLQKYLNRNV